VVVVELAAAELAVVEQPPAEPGVAVDVVPARPTPQLVVRVAPAAADATRPLADRPQFPTESSEVFQ
jgi:hypothetical protein